MDVDYWWCVDVMMTGGVWMWITGGVWMLITGGVWMLITGVCGC